MLNEKERFLAGSGDPRSARLLELADERGRLDGELREIAEAARAADAVADDLAALRERLRSAATWSDYDVSLGGALGGSAVMHSRLDETAALAARADRNLAVLRTALADVPGRPVIASQLSFDCLTRLAGVWLESVLADVAVRGQIRHAAAHAARCVTLVDDVRRRLNQRAASARERLATTATERRDLLTTPPTAQQS
ncbi:hypothetical protein ACFOOK_02880 [Micromonospora krabiensis]|uniref:Uncharacterized protein n=1 Tax=Micromonospora krabiensis TaxID=307121 RepID=A0A1C3MWI8_9ACTN|nr:hypothetical protein [Micromonospora krabiensis]SBV24699.1 hypothetical protein GA0070620_0133 [Micromonospora krabiensis]